MKETELEEFECIFINVNKEHGGPKRTNDHLLLFLTITSENKLK